MTDKPVFGPAPTASLGIPRFELDLTAFVEASARLVKAITEHPTPQAEAALKALGIDPKREGNED